MIGLLWNRLGKIKTRDLLTKVTLLKAVEDQLAIRANCALIVCAAADTEAQSFLALKPAGGEAAMLDQGRFALFLPDAQDAGQLLSLARTLTVKLGGGTKVYAGIAQQSPGDTAAALLAHAELALSAAQKQGVPGYGFLDPEVARMESRRAAVMKVVENSAAANAFNLEFQPVYGMRTGALDGFEALIRVRDSGLGNISPAEFIPLAEQCGAINQIGAWCLREACMVAARWPAHLKVAVNLSPVQFESGSLIADVRRALDESGLPAYRLELEITEGALLASSELVLHQLRTLRDMGVAVALDDFGTGYSSLSYLWKFPFSKLKIDRSFVWALDEKPEALGIMRAIIKLGHGLGLAVTAEGIETVRQHSTLRGLGCDLAQGFLLDRPARVEDLAAIVMRNFANGLPRRKERAAAARA